MYEIIASDEGDGAILRKKKDGKLCYSSLWMPILEKNLQGFREGQVKVYIDRSGFIPHNPPTPVEKLEDWPKAATEYEERYKKAHATAAA